MNLQTPITQGSRSMKMYAGRLEKLGIYTYGDFLFHLPSRYEDFSLVSKIGQLQAGETVTAQGQIISIANQYMRGRRIKTIQKATVADESGRIEVIWFNQPFLTKTLTEGITVSLSGRVEQSKKGLSMSSPDYEVLFANSSQPLHTGRLVPIYPETAGVTSKWIRRQIHNVLTEYAQELTEYLPEELLKKNNFPHFADAVREVHFPRSMENAEKARERLAFDELLFLQLAADKRRSEWKEKKSTSPINIDKYRHQTDTLIQSLPFKLTGSQEKAIKEVFSDIATTTPMNRLLQGDVGSGKTIVAAIAMYATYLNGFQSVLMAPTEILAIQHYETISILLSKLGAKVELRTGSRKGTVEMVKGKEKNKLNASPLNLDADILVGTHAVLSEKIKFKSLALVVIDEQQRFGVTQRSLIREKGTNPHLLTMTATPIPRTVALTMYGDLDISYLSEMPKDRKRVKTWLVPPEKRTAAYGWIRKQLSETESQAFIICPFIEESESMQTVRAAKTEYERLRNEIFPDLKLGMLHGKMKAKEKDSVLLQFRQGDYDILVATPVVEVGIDVPNATIILIEASERFGLAQLHQLRGRVGRGEKQSFCLLFTDNQSGQQSQRLKGMETLYSGAELAELDLKLRGPGNIYGTSQHGLPKLKAASFSDTSLIQLAKHEAEQIFPKLSQYPDIERHVENVTVQKVAPD